MWVASHMDVNIKDLKPRCRLCVIIEHKSVTIKLIRDDFSHVGVSPDIKGIVKVTVNLIAVAITQYSVCTGNDFCITVPLRGKSMQHDKCRIFDKYVVIIVFRLRYSHTVKVFSSFLLCVEDGCNVGCGNSVDSFRGENQRISVIRDVYTINRTNDTVRTNISET